MDALIEDNVGFVARLLEVTAKWPVRRFVHTGSCSEYGMASSEGSYFCEEQPLSPISLYGAAKAASLLYAHALAIRLGVPFVTLRLFGVLRTSAGWWKQPIGLLNLAWLEECDA